MIDDTDVPPDSYLLQAHHDEEPLDLWPEPGEVITFPRPFREPLPPDAHPTCRARDVEISPFKGKWHVLEWDEGGGWHGSFATKSEALAAAIKWIDDGDAELRVFNRPLPECYE